jgi:protein involved in polysaccharide export with SLBB domain
MVRSALQKSLTAFFTVILFLAIPGCPPTGQNTIKAPATLEQDTTLGPGDVFDVRVFNEESLSSTYQISPDGTIDYPLIGRITVADLRPQEIAAYIAKELKEGRFLKNPQVSVLVKEYKSKKVHVLGQVKSPGTFPFQDEMTVVQAVTAAGGFTPLAAQNKTTITRKLEGKEMIIRAEVAKISKGEAPNISLQAGDIIFVPERVF